MALQAASLRAATTKTPASSSKTSSRHAISASTAYATGCAQHLNHPPQHTQQLTVTMAAVEVVQAVMVVEAVLQSAAAVVDLMLGVTSSGRCS
jgi:hypothetical protein